MALPCGLTVSAATGRSPEQRKPCKINRAGRATGQRDDRDLQDLLAVAVLAASAFKVEDGRVGPCGLGWFIGLPLWSRGQAGVQPTTA